MGTKTEARDLSKFIEVSFVRFEIVEDFILVKLTIFSPYRDTYMYVYSV